MAYEPEKITKQNVLDAVTKIETENRELKPSTKFDVIINGKPYPPKEVMRYAHELMNGENTWKESGGEPTNKYLIKMGFEIKGKTNYYVLGSVWYEGNKGEDQTDRFLKNEMWINAKEEERFSKIVNEVKIGDRVALKSSFATKGGKSNLRIKALGTVSGNSFDGENLKIDWDNNFESFDIEGLGSYRNTIQKVSENDIEAIFNRTAEASKSHKSIENFAFNTILYGPPGTGKTFHSIDYAVQIAAGHSGEHKANKIEFDKFRKVGQIEFVTFHQNYSYEDFMVGIRPAVEESTLKFTKHKGIFYELVQRARENYTASLLHSGVLMAVADLVNNLLDRLRNGEKIALKTSLGYDFSIEYLSEESIQLIYSNGSKNNTLSVDTLSDIIDEKREFTSSLKTYYLPLKNYLIKDRIKANEIKQELKNFVLIIDEINRANISKVFGELITLLEDDKRLGNENELRITLPNGERDFGIPPNLYIIGTMNTADKSIALIDIALRRRFEFIGHYPKYEDLNTEESELLKKINTSILEKKKSADYLIGHAYFMQSLPIEKVLERKVVPLLMEYFSGKTDIVSSVFENSNWSVKYDNTFFSWTISRI